MKKVSITHLTEYAKRSRRDQLQIVNIELTREAKRNKREAGLNRLAYTVDAINHALNK